MVARQARTAKSTPPRPRGRPRKAVEARTESPTATTTADLLRKLQNSVGKKGGKDVRQKLQAQHKASVKEAEGILQETSRLNERTMAEFRKSQVDRLKEFVKRKAEIETELLSHLKRVEEKYFTTSKETRAMLATRLETLR